METARLPRHDKQSSLVESCDEVAVVVLCQMVYLGVTGVEGFRSD